MTKITYFAPMLHPFKFCQIVSNHPVYSSVYWYHVVILFLSDIFSLEIYRNMLESFFIFYFVLHCPACLNSLYFVSSVFRGATANLIIIKKVFFSPCIIKKMIIIRNIYNYSYYYYVQMARAINKKSNYYKNS